MQEEVENRTVNLAISTTKLTGRTIIAGIRKYLQHREKVKMKKARDPAVHGKQSVKQLLGQNQGATNVEIDKESIRDFEKLAKKYGVDFAVRKDKSVDPPRFLVFVRSKDADALDAICKEHQARALLIPERTHPKTVKTWNFPAYPNILDSSPFFCLSISKAPFAIIDELAPSNPSIIIKSFSCFCHSIQSVSIQSDT